MDTGITIRDAVDGDLALLVEFNCRLAVETEGKQLNRDVVNAGVRRGLHLSPEVGYYVAETAGQVVGQLMLTREWSDWRNGWIVWLQSVYVAPEFRGQGIFRSLLTHVRERLRKQPNTIGQRLYVENENTSAQTTYRRLGFTAPGYSVMEALDHE